MHKFSLKKIGQSLILLLVAMLPILFLPTSTFSVEPLKIFLVSITGLITLLIVLVQKIKQNSFSITTNFFILSLIGILITTIFSTIFSNNLGISLFGRQITPFSLLGLFSLASLSFATFSLFDDLRSKTNLFITFFISGVAVVAIHFLAIIIPFFPTLGFFFGNNVNTVGTMMDLGLFTLLIVISSVLVLKHLARSSFYRMAALVGLTVGMLTLLLINSGLLFILATASALLYIVIDALSMHSDDQSKSISYPALSVFILSVLFLLIGGKAGMILNSYFNIEIGDVRPSINATLEVTRDVVVHEPILNKLFGVGIDRFEIAWLQYRPDAINLSQFWDTNFRFGYSFISSVGVTQGIVGIIVWLCAVLCALYYIQKIVFSLQKVRHVNFIHLYFTFIFAFLLLVLLIFNPSIVLFTLFFVFLGLFVSTLKDLELIYSMEFSLAESPRVSFAYILMLVVGMIVIVYGLYVHASQYISRVTFDRASVTFAQTGNVNDAIQGVINANFIYTSDVYQRALIDLGMLRLQEIIQDKNLTQDQAGDMFGEVLSSVVIVGQNALAYDSKSYITHLSLLGVYKNLMTFGVPDAKQQAFLILEKIDEIVPNNPTMHLERARVHAINKEYDSAVENIQKALEVKQNYTAAVFFLSQIQVDRGQINEAIASTRVLISANRFDPTLYFRLGILHYNQNNFQDAIVAFENALRVAPNFANARYFLGLSYYQNNRSTDAVAVFENLNSAFPENTEIQKILFNMRAGGYVLEGIQPPPETRSDLPLEDEELKTDENAEPVEEDGQN